MTIPICAFAVLAGALFIAVHWFALRRRVEASDDTEYDGAGEP